MIIMARYFGKGFEITANHYAEVMYEDFELEGMTEEEILEMANEDLYAAAQKDCEYDIIWDDENPEELEG